jgi:hypothetical protein
MTRQDKIPLTRPPESQDATTAPPVPPGWNVWASDSGHLNATTSRSLTSGSGTTLDADDPAALTALIEAFDAEYVMGHRGKRGAAA